MLRELRAMSEEQHPLTVYPLEVRRDAGGGAVEIRWSDGHVSRYPWQYLRGWCPCAGCQGHGTKRRFIGVKNAQLQRVFVVGRYALGFRWEDGHETGIYSYSYLRQLCPCCHPEETND